MARKKIVKPLLFCDNCKHLEWITNEFLDYKGLPIFFNCKYQRYAKIRGNEACEHYKQKE